MTTTTPNPTIRWDELDIINEQIRYLEIEVKDPDFLKLSEAERFDYVCADPDLFQSEWKYICDWLTEWMGELNQGAYWRADREYLGWRKCSGYKEFKALTGQELLREVLPDTQCTFSIERIDGTLVIDNAHHDAPTGETYTIRPLVN